jgi:hypothetical protein
MIPSVLVTRRLPEAVERRLTQLFRTVLNESDEPLDREALEAAMREHDALVSTITDRIDAALIATKGLRVQIIANFGLTDKGLSRYAAIQSGEIAGQRFPRLLTGPDDRPVAACTPQHDRVTLFGDFPLKGLRIGDSGPIQFRDFV